MKDYQVHNHHHDELPKPTFSFAIRLSTHDPVFVVEQTDVMIQASKNGVWVTAFGPFGVERMNNTIVGLGLARDIHERLKRGDPAEVVMAWIKSPAIQLASVTVTPPPESAAAVWPTQQPEK